MTPHPSARLKLVIHGAVQGVGFRPCVRRLATAMGLSGWVRNSPQGVDIEVEGPRAVLEQFLHRLEKEKPEHCRIQRCETSWLPPVGDDTFEIEESAAGGVKTALVLPDLATCPDCLREMFDPANRRYLYPFTNCTHCGPRFSIIEALPYDRANTSMKAFAMCPACQAEYDNPDDRRYHAQPNACPVCGPQLELWEAAAAPSESPRAMARNYLALLVAARAIRRGQIVALKGIGGFHLIVDARNDVAVRRLRGRKHREEKPLALLFPDLETVRAACDVSAPEAKLLLSREAPIVLLRRRPGSSCACCEPDELCAAVAPAPNLIAPAVAPGNPNLGVMLPSNPLHHLLLAELGFPVVATSGNLTDEPICTDEREALERLRGIADVFLVHNRPIVRHVDDSIVRVMLGEESIVRRARGYAPLPVETGGKSGDGSAPILAVGGQLKNAVALECRGQAFISQHIGDLESTQANLAFRRVIADFEKMYDATPALVVADRHPDYLSTRFAQAHRPLLVQHHVAHVLSCLADNQLTPPALGVAWDGTGYGDDGTIWGGEFFRITAGDIERVAHLRPFRLPGGEAAIKEPRRAAIGLLFELFGDVAFGLQSLAPLREFKPLELENLRRILKRRVNAPLTSSAGRLFDAVASLAGLRQTMNFEGQAAMELEFCRDALKTDQAYHFSLQDHRWREEAGRDRSQLILDWEPVVQAILSDLRRGTAPGTVSAKFHNALAEAIVGVAKRVGEPRVLLSGGCFQNRYLTERTVVRLRAEGFQPAWHHHVPANDGGIALGQLVAAHRAAAQPLRPAPSIHRMNLCALPSPEKSKASAAKTH